MDRKTAAAERIPEQTDGERKGGKGAKPRIRPLRVWPPVVLVLLLWGLRIGPGLLSEPSFGLVMAQFMGPPGIAALILLWWLLFSRASLQEKLLGTVGLPAAVAAAWLLADKTVAGFGILIFAVPWGATAFAVGAICVRRWYPGRTAVALVAAVVALGYWDLVRLDEFHGDFTVVQNWRWEPTAEERFLATLAARSPQPNAELPDEADAPLADPEWPEFRGAERKGEQPDVVLEEDWAAHPPQEIWRVPVGPGWSSFAVAGNRLFTQQQRGDQEAVVCYSARDGHELWVHQDESRFWENIGGAGPRGTPTVAGDGLYTLGANGLLNRLNPTSGQLVWQRDLRQDAQRSPPTWGFSSSPLVTHGLVIVHAGGKGDLGLLAYDGATGDLRWTVPAGDHSYSSPQLSAVDGKECVLMLTNKGITFVDPASGSVIGEHANECEGYRVIQPSVFDDAGILVGTPMTGTQRVEARWNGERFTTRTRWDSTRMKPHFNDFVIHQGFLYGLDNNILACVDLRDGSRKWKRGRYGTGQVLLLPSAGQLLVIGEAGQLVLLRADPKAHVELARRDVLSGRTWNHPVLVDNRLYVRNGQEAVCLELATRERR